MVERFAIACPSSQFTHREACRVYDQALRAPARTVVIDFSNVVDATTSGFARLVLLRRRLLRAGRDIVLTGLGHRAARLYEVSRLDGVLPCRRSIEPQRC